MGIWGKKSDRKSTLVTRMFAAAVSWVIRMNFSRVNASWHVLSVLTSAVTYPIILAGSRICMTSASHCSLE